MNTVAVIPTRYGSTRFPGKPLALLGGVSVIERTWRQVRQAVGRVLVATDDERIAREVRRFGGRAVMTSDSHTCGTTRVEEAVEIAAPDAELVINVQGDEPMISPALVTRLAEVFSHDPSASIATAVYPVVADAYDSGTLPGMAEALCSDPNTVKVVTDCRGRALYFSRLPIPYVRDRHVPLPAGTPRCLLHLGVYAYRADVLAQIAALPPSPLEEAEKLEQLRWLQAGYSIATVRADSLTVGIDTPADLLKAEKLLRNG